MYLEAILLGLLIGFIRNGSINNFINSKFRGWFLTPLAAIVFLSPYFLKILNLDIIEHNLPAFIGMLVCMVILLFNMDKSGIKLILIGSALNLIVMALNNYYMPVDTGLMSLNGLESFAESIRQGNVINYIDVSKAHVISGFLGKVIVLPDWYPLNRLLSIGDIIVSIGVVLLIQDEMIFHVSRVKGSMVSFGYKSRSRN